MAATSNSFFSCVNVCFLAPVPPTLWHRVTTNQREEQQRRQRHMQSWSVPYKLKSSVHEDDDHYSTTTTTTSTARRRRVVISNSLATDMEKNIKRTLQQQQQQQQANNGQARSLTSSTTTTTTKTKTRQAPKRRRLEQKTDHDKDDVEDNVDTEETQQSTRVDNKNQLQHMRVFNRDWYLSGRMMLFLTPILWSGYGVSIKYMYSLPWSLPTPVFNFLRLALASAIVLPGFIQYLRDDPKRMKSAAVIGGLEIGTWTFLVNILQLLGLQHSSASIAAFLCQLNSVFVPFAAFFCGMENSIPFQVYIASILSVVGVALFSLDDFAMPFSFQGEGLLLMSAFAATAFILRSKTHAGHKEFNAVLASKILVQVVIASIYAIPTMWDFISTQMVNNNTNGMNVTVIIQQALHVMFNHATPLLMLINFLVVLYNGLGVCWLSTVFQLKGQSSVSATEACVTFSSTPIWSAVMALPIGERFGSHGLIGAGMIVLATLLASLKSTSQPTKPPAQDV